MIINNREKILFIGDSITDYGRGRPVGERLGLGNGFVRSIDTILHVCDPENLYHIVNMGTDGDTAGDILKRFDTDVLALKPDVVVCTVGVNDVWRHFDSPEVFDWHVTIEEYSANLQKIIDKTKGKIRKLIFMTPYFLETHLDDPMRKMMDDFRAEMKRVSEKNGIMCVDLQEPFDEYLKYRYNTFIIWDRVHPSWIGSLIIARTFLKSVGFDKQLI